ncbi:tetratricopeptide repeat protein [Aquabacterium sp.]|uniref:tetratricopeptide repeat protein n=1 Tax=Aquabacterium sp. TaxID=1872578 RepID=UPI00345B66AC
MLESVRRGMSCAVMVGVLAALAACSSAPKKDDAAARLAAQQQLNESLAAAELAQKQGQPEKAILQLDKAIQADPASKEPWLRKAQIHFDARHYGQAITSSQEVLQRDVNDLTAKSILAVSGLRVSADALEQLRKANEVTGSTRSEAESVARIIREALGEPIIIPATAAGEGGGKPKAPIARVAPRPMVRPNPGTTVPPAAMPVAKSTPASGNVAPATSGRNNPFGALQ